MTDLIPTGLLAELSHRCPLSCPYCSNPVQLQRRSDEIDTDAWLQVFRQAADLGVLQVHLSGGEPTVRDDLEDIVRVCAEVDLYTNLITSGVLLTEDRLRRLATAGLDHVQLSFQAATAALSDEIGAFKGFEKKLATARFVRDAGLPLTINAVVHRNNLHHVDDLLDLAISLQAERIEIAHTQYIGRALKNRADLLPTWPQVQATNDLIRRRRKDLRGRLLIDYVVPDLYALRPKACMGGWGRELLVVAPNGDVLPCHGASSLPDLPLDNVTENSLQEIWTSSPAFQRFRGTHWMPEPCRSCDRRDLDFGGCRCQAFAISGDPARTDPVCELSPDHRLVDRLLPQS